MDDQDTPPVDNSSQLVDLASELGDSTDSISKDLQMLLQRGLHGAKLPKQLRSQKAGEAFQSAFEVIGGVTRLALWADRNPDKFYPLFARMIPQTVAPVVADLPQTTKSLSQVHPSWLTARRLAYQESAEVAEDIQIKPALPNPRDG